jgi:hypothetical protein
VNRAEIYERWAPPEGRWTPWVKPVLFSHLDEDAASPIGALPDWAREVADAIAALPPAEAPDQHPFRSTPLDDVAVVVDLPGESGVLAGLALAERGFRPVPLYNASPGMWAVVDVTPILRLLASGAAKLDGLPGAAPPAFLLDGNRMGRGGIARAEQLGIVNGSSYFDNRSVCLPTDFPSAATLRSAGVRRAVLVQEAGGRPSVDLAPTLHAWQEAGIALLLKGRDVAGPAVPRTLPRPSWIRQLLHRLGRLFLKRNPGGDFGRAVLTSGTTSG